MTAKECKMEVLEEGMENTQKLNTCCTVVGNSMRA